MLEYLQLLQTLYSIKRNKLEEFLLRCNVGDDLDENTEFNENLPESMNHF